MTDANELARKAETFLGMHRGSGILVLPNAWDVASAKVIEGCSGCHAIGTSSAGTAAVLGYVDRKGITREEMLDMVGRIAGAVDVPVTADVEAGYGDTSADAAETARQVIAAGAVGLNLEDGQSGQPPSLLPAPLQVEKIAAVREAARAAGVPLVINARTDAYWLGIGDQRAMLEESLARAHAYLEVGADCVFVPGVADPATIRVLVEEIPGPLNVLATAGTPGVSELERLGVARVSVGSGFMRGVLRSLQRMAEEYLTEGTYGSFAEMAIPYAELSSMLER